MQGHGDQQGEGKSTVPCNLVPRSIGGLHPWVRGSHFLFTVPCNSPARFFPRRIFYFFDWNTPQHLLVPQMSAIPAEPLNSFQQRSLQRSRTVSDVPPSPHRHRINPQLKPLHTAYHIHRHNVLCPRSPTALREETLLQLPPFLLHHVPDFCARHKFGKQIGTFFPSKQSSNCQFGESSSENCGDLAGR